MKSYTELLFFQTFKERFDYLVLHQEFGIETFGHARYLNQEFYKSKEWKNVRRQVILRDEANDLGIQNYPIYGSIRIHHMNPISIEDFQNENFKLITDPEYLISTSLDTHNAIHYGTEKNLKIPLIERKKGDSCPWVVF